MLHPIYQPLTCHPKSPASYIETIQVCCELTATGQLWLRYHIEVPEPMLLVADTQEPFRTDNLWKTTCCEVFLGAKGKCEYIEFNFCPSSRWAAYHFSDYRENSTDLPIITTPEIHLDMSNSHFALEATVQLPPEWQHKAFDAGITVVAEEPDGIISYWALDHQKTDPEFHDRSCFTLNLEAAEQP